MSYFMILRKPSVVFAAIIIGALTGIYFKSFSELIAPFGDIYLSFLKMLVIPIMITAIISSLGKLFASKGTAYYLRKTIMIFFACLVIVSMLGVAISVIVGPGNNISDSARDTLGGTIMAEEEAVSDQMAEVEDVNALFFLKMLVPTNIFESLVGEESLQVLFVAIVFGIAIGVLKEEKRDDAIDFFEVMFKSLEKVINWTLYGLPFALISLMASQFANMGFELIGSMMQFILVIIAVCLLCMMLSALLIWKVTKRTPLQSMRDIKDPLLIGFGTRNSLATMPSILQSLQRKYDVHENIVNLIVPLSIIICRYSIIILFTTGSMFVAQLYGFSLSVGQVLFIIFVAIFASLAGAGAPLLVSLSLISILLSPLGLPVETALVLLLAIVPLVDPFLTMVNVHITCSAVLLIDQPVEDQEPTTNSTTYAYSQGGS